MKYPWIKNYEGSWENGEGLALSINVLNDKKAIVDIFLNDKLFKLAWNNDEPAKKLDACLDPDDGGALIVSLDRPGLEMHLSYEHIDQMNQVVNELSVGVSYYASDNEAEKYIQLFGKLLRFYRV